MQLKRMGIESWFIKTKNVRYNFSESGVPDFNLSAFLKRINANESILGNVYLGNNTTWGSLDLRQEIAGIYNNVRAENLLITTGTSEALYIFFNIFLKKNSTVFILHPAFPPLYLIPRAIGARVYLFNALKCEDKEELLKKITLKLEKIKPDLLIINTPHNPMGFAFNEEETIKIAKVAQKYNIAILFDEHYRFLPVNHAGKSFPSGYDIASRLYRNIFALGSVIKCAGIVGTRVGWLIAENPVLQRVRDYKDYITHCTPLINEIIVKLAIKNIHQIAEGFIERVKANWIILKDSRLVKNKRIILNYELEGGCVYFPKIEGYGSLKLAGILYEKHGISVMPGEFFDCPKHIRINLAQRIKDFRRLLDKIEDIF